MMLASISSSISHRIVRSRLVVRAEGTQERHATEVETESEDREYLRIIEFTISWMGGGSSDHNDEEACRRKKRQGKKRSCLPEEYRISGDPDVPNSNSTDEVESLRRKDVFYFYFLCPFSFFFFSFLFFLNF